MCHAFRLPDIIDGIPEMEMGTCFMSNYEVHSVWIWWTAIGMCRKVIEKEVLSNWCKKTEREMLLEDVFGEG